MSQLDEDLMVCMCWVTPYLISRISFELHRICILSHAIAHMSGTTGEVYPLPSLPSHSVFGCRQFHTADSAVNMSRHTRNDG